MCSGTPGEFVPLVAVGTGSRHPTYWPRVIWTIGLLAGAALAVYTHHY